MNGFGCQLFYFLLELTHAVSISNTFPVDTNQPFFQETVYLARIFDDKLQFNNGPLTFIKPSVDNVTFLVTSGNSGNFAVIPDEHTINIVIIKRPIKEFLITIEVLNDKQVTIARTHVVILTQVDYDPYKLVFEYEGSKYVVLNYFYFKWFCFSLILLGVLIVILELYDIIRDKCMLDDKNDCKYCYNELENNV